MFRCCRSSTIDLGSRAIANYFQSFILWKDWRLIYWVAVFLTAQLLSVIEYLFAELLHPPSNPVSIFDLGFTITQPLYDILAANPFYNDAFAWINTCFSMFVAAYPFYLAFFHDEVGSLTAGLVVFMARCLCGLLTTIPVHKEYLPSAGDWPNCLWGNGAAGARLGMPLTAKDTGFFTFFSGHVAAPMLVIAKLNRDGWRKGALLVHFGNAVQMVRLLATRGHWSIDLFIGTLLGWWSTNLARELDAAVVRGKEEKASAGNSDAGAKRD